MRLPIVIEEHVIERWPLYLCNPNVSQGALHQGAKDRTLSVKAGPPCLFGFEAAFAALEIPPVLPFIAAYRRAFDVPDCVVAVDFSRVLGLSDRESSCGPRSLWGAMVALLKLHYSTDWPGSSSKLRQPCVTIRCTRYRSFFCVSEEIERGMRTLK